MCSFKLIAWMAFALCSVSAQALPVDVAFEWPPNAKPPAGIRVHVHAVRSAGYTSGAQPLDSETTANALVLNLGPGVWQVQASAPGYWSQETQVTVSGRDHPSARLAMWPAASLHGSVSVPDGDPLPGEVEVRLSSVPTTPNAASAPGVTTQQYSEPAHATLHCRVATTNWDCMGPSGMFDLRITSGDYAPRYEWDVLLKATAITDLGQIALRRTASVVGRVLRRDGSNPPLPCRATLLPDLARDAPGGPDQESAVETSRPQTVSVSVNQRGYFQVVGIAPGRYALSVVCQDASGFRQLRVQTSSETRIDPPMLLGDLTLDVALSPKLDPEGQPWHLTLDQAAPYFLRIAGRNAVPSNGHWIRRGLTEGKYRVTVSNSRRTTWLQRYIDLLPKTRPLSLQLGSVNVSGRVSLSSQPVRARLVFSNNAGGGTVTLSSDEDGRFQGVLPASGVQESTWTIEAHVVQPPITQRVLDVHLPPANGMKSQWLDLDLPAIAVHGSVVSTNGEPQRAVQVTCEDAKGIRTTTSTDDAGHFEFPDLQPGKYTALADSPDGASERTPFEVAQGGGSEVKLVLNPFKRVAFYVRSSQGPIENAAVQVWIAPGVPRTFARTDQDGRFDFTLPPGTNEVGFTVAVPGYAIKLMRLKIPAEDVDSPDSHTIDLDTGAGSLVLNLPTPGSSRDAGTPLYLVHNRAIEDARALVSWSTQQGAANGNAPPFLIEAIEPGKYALCGLDPGQVATLWQGALPQDRCRSGSLDQGGTLTLSQP